MKFGLLSIVTNQSGWGVGATLLNLFSLSIWIGRVLQISVNKTTLQWSRGKRYNDVILLWGCMRVRYMSEAR